jgi:hypothetical protein
MKGGRRVTLVCLLLSGLLAAADETRTVVVPGNAAWTDAGIEVFQGQGIEFAAEGTLSLQRGNPQAECGPDGYDLRTLQQPLLDQNLGALIGKVVIGVTVIKDKKTGQERTEEAAEFFYIGARSRVEMPAKGRLFLGINELVIGDNAGEFTVTVVIGSEGRHLTSDYCCCSSAGTSP